MTKCEICTILPQIKQDFILYEGEHWLANLRDRDQTLLGTSFVTARRHVPELNLLTPEEESELTIIRNALIVATTAAFRPININVSCLKNDAFQKDPDNTPPEAGHVHWHIKPRYGTKPVTFAGESFVDPFPGRYLSQYDRYRPPRATVIAIADAIRRNISL